MTRYALFVYRLILSIKALLCEIPSIVIFSCSYRMSWGRLFNTQVEFEMTQRLDIVNVFPPEKWLFDASEIVIIQNATYI